MTRCGVLRRGYSRKCMGAALRDLPRACNSSYATPRIGGSSAAGGLFLPAEVEIHAREVLLQPHIRRAGVALQALEPRDAGGCRGDVAVGLAGHALPGHRLQVFSHGEPASVVGSCPSRYVCKAAKVRDQSITGFQRRSLFSTCLANVRFSPVSRPQSGRSKSPLRPKARNRYDRSGSTMLVRDPSESGRPSGGNPTLGVGSRQCVGLPTWKCPWPNSRFVPTDDIHGIPRRHGFGYGALLLSVFREETMERRLAAKMVQKEGPPLYPFAIVFLAPGLSLLVL